MSKKIIVISSDHNGVQAKQDLKIFIKSLGHNVIDLGPHQSDTSVDYVDYAQQVASIIQSGDADRGVLICGTGVGMSIVANRFSQVRAVLAHNHTTAVKSREHNDSNILCLGAWISEIEDLKKMTNDWLNEAWGRGRHIKRTTKIDTNTGIVMTNGVYDLLHEGHLELLKFAKRQGDKLVVAIDSDQRVKELKGPSRPINNETVRRKLLESNKYVDEVVIFDSSEELQRLYQKFKASVVVRGSEFTEEQIRQRDKIPQKIKIKIFPHIKNLSTTNLIKKIKKENDR